MSTSARIGRLGKWALLALALLAMPFCWSFGRDVVAIALVSDAEERVALHRHLVRSLMQTQTWSTTQREWRGQALYTTVNVLPRCYEVSSNALRNALDEGGRPEIFGETDRLWLMTYVWAAEAMVDRSVDLDQATRAFGSVEASALRACIESTPFSGLCATRRAAQFDASRRLNEWDDLHRRLGTRRRVIDADGRFRGRYCDTMPSLQDQ